MPKVSAVQLQARTMDDFLGVYLRLCREEQHMSQVDFAALLTSKGFRASQRTVSWLESGNNWTLHNVCHVWRALGVDPWRVAYDAERDAQDKARQDMPLLTLAAAPQRGP